MDVSYSTQATALLAAIVLCFAPGSILLAVSDTARRVPAALLPATALTLTIVTAIPVMLLQWALRQPISFAVMVTLGWVVAATLILSIREVRDGTSVQRVLLRLLLWPVMWIRSVPRGITAVAVTTAVLAYALGERFYPDADAWFHAALSMKLAELRHPGMHNVAQFMDGDAHPGYLIPVWHQQVAMISHTSHAAVIVAMQLLPVIIGSTTVLTWAGLGQIVFRSPAAGTLTAVAVLTGRMIMTIPGSDGIANGAEARSIAANIIMPLMWSLALLLIVQPELAQAGITSNLPHTDRGEKHRGTSIRLGFTAVAAAISLAVVHASYVVWVSIGLCAIGIAVFAAPRAPDYRAVRTRAFGWLMALLFAMAAVIALLLPAAGKLEHGIDSGQAATHAVVIGHAWNQHMRADYTIWYGAVALVGLSALIVLTRYVDDVLVAFIPVAGALVVCAVIVPGPFHVLVIGIGEGQSTRAYLAVPWALALGGVAALLGAFADRSPQRARLMIAGTIVASVIALWIGSWARPLRTRSSPMIIHPAIVYVIAVSLVVALMIGYRRARRRKPGAPLRFHASSLATVLGAGVIATLALPTLARQADVTYGAFGSGLVARKPIPALRHYDLAIQNRLTTLAPGATVLADTGASYVLMGIAPVYVVAAPAGHVAATRANHPLKRITSVETFFSPTTTDAERQHVLESTQPDWLLVATTPEEHAALEFARDHDQILEPVIRGKHHWLFRVR